MSDVSVSNRHKDRRSEQRDHSMVMLVLFVGAIVGLNVSSAIVLKTLASQDAHLIVIGLGLGIVFLLNGLRLVVWMFANRRFPLSTTYPLTSVFFPVMLGVSFAYDEEITLSRIMGTLLITSGVFWLGWRVNRSKGVPLAPESAQSESPLSRREEA